METRPSPIHSMPGMNVAGLVCDLASLSVWWRHREWAPFPGCLVARGLRRSPAAPPPPPPHHVHSNMNTGGPHTPSQIAPCCAPAPSHRGPFRTHGITQVGVGPVARIPWQAPQDSTSIVVAWYSRQALLDITVIPRPFVPPLHCTERRPAPHWPFLYSSASAHVRLVGGPDAFSGRVEVKYQGRWGTICDDMWDDADAAVVCRSLGLGGGAAHVNALHGPGNGPIWLDDVECSGTEKDLVECSHAGWAEVNGQRCSHREDASVTCEGVALGMMVRSLLTR